MAKKSKFLSWFGLGKKDEQAKQQEQQAQLEAERQAQEQAAEAARIEAERKAQEQTAEEARLEAERKAQEQAAEAARIEAERQAQEQAAEAARQAQEQVVEEEARLEAERQAQEQAAEEARLEGQRQAQEQAAEAARIEAERQAQEQAAEAARIEAERQAQEQAAEAAHIEAERQAQEQAAEAARIEAERQAQEQAAEAARIEAERQAQEQAAEAARIEAERKAQEQAAEAARIEAERQAQEQAAEAARLEAERQAQEQAAEEARLEAERHAQEQAAEAARIEAERQAQEAEVAQSEEKQEAPKKSGFFSRLKQGLLKTKSNIGSGFASLFVGKKIDDELFEELETQLLTADVGVDTTVKLIDSLTDAADRKQLKDGDALYDLLKQEMADMLASAEQPLEINKKDGPFVILMVGVNGVGKTTTIGKLAKQYQQEGKSVMLAAGDTFRAAAVEQLQVWGERNNIPVIAQHTGADSASVVFDAFQAAKARNVDVLIADTAGRLQNKDNLMQELEKIARVMKKLDPQAPHEVMLTIDAGTGQNAISQVNLFDKAVGLTGITLTKLDGTAKGGVIFAIADKFKTPIRYIGVGEGIDDLRTFKSDDFIEALFSGEQ
ncbi:signal recognition particle-docking protein FtsY [Pseudoalteromonas sp. YIC-656]|uniref:signal recognition particle-docking protein FtsY n=1 Tax=Pseudoalteromonas pernae TaxID=3118054 RepID=UPI003242A9C7